MDFSELALPPEGTALQMALLTTFDLDLSALSALPQDALMAGRILVFCGDGRFRDCRQDDPLRDLLHRALVPVIFPPAKTDGPGRMPTGRSPYLCLPALPASACTV